MEMNILLAVLEDIWLSIICGFATTHFHMKWCLISVALATVFATSLFLLAVFTKAVREVNYKFLFICTAISSVVLVILEVFEVAKLHTQVITILLACVQLLISAIFIYAIVKMIWEAGAGIKSDEIVYFSCLMVTLTASSFFFFLAMFPSKPTAK
uniref:Uncharacterized protein n=1 Tax=Trichobilharzia regenti TaxID=157069 RepID=A0AA85IV93_TRIRE|nr:unnamed protein product [Trichobilharzia regenti]